MKDGEERTLVKVGEEMNLSREWVRQIEIKALKNLPEKARSFTTTECLKYRKSRMQNATTFCIKGRFSFPKALKKSRFC